MMAQMLADILKRRVETVGTEETGCLGAALLGAISIGEIKDVEEAAEMVKVKEEYCPKKDYSKKYETFKKSCGLFPDIWNSIESMGV